MCDSICFAIPMVEGITMIVFERFIVDEFGCCQGDPADRTRGDFDVTASSNFAEEQFSDRLNIQ